MKIKQMIRIMLCTTLVLLSVTGTAFAALDTDNIVEETEREEAYRITFDGKSYSLPCEVAEFEKNGWALKNYNVEAEVPGLTYTELALTKGDKKLKINILNDLADATALKDCKVASITIEGDLPAFSTSKGVKIGTTIDAVKKAHGNERFRVPYTYSDGKTESLEYSYITQKEGQEFRMQPIFASFDHANKIEYTFTNGKVSRIVMEHYVIGEIGEPYDGSVTYMDDYKKPSTLGTDLASFYYSIDGTLYHFPTPVQELIKNGFKVQDETGVPGLSDKTFTLSKKEKTVFVSMKNDDPRFMDVKNTYLRYLKDSNSEPQMHIMLPGNLTIGSSERDLLKVCPNLKIRDKGKQEKNGVTYEKRSSGDECIYVVSNSSDERLEITVAGKKIDEICFIKRSDWSK